MTNNINTTNKLTELSQYLNNLNLKLGANGLSENKRIDLIPILNRMLAEIEMEGQTLSLASRIIVLEDDSKDLSQLQHELSSSLQTVKDVWEGVYHNCIGAQLASLTKTFIDAKLAFDNNPQQSPEITKKQYKELKKIENELKLLNLNSHLNESERRSIKSYLPDVKELLVSIQQRMEEDCANAPIVTESFTYIEDSSALNIGQFDICSNDILENLLSFLSPEDLARLSRSSKFFHNMCSDNFFWKNILQREFLSINISDNQSAKETYISQKAMINGLQNGFYTSSILMEGHISSIATLGMQQEGNLVFSLPFGRGHGIKIHDLTTNQCIATLDANCSDLSHVSCIHKEGDFLVSGSGEMIKIWDLRDLTKIECLATLRANCSIKLLLKQGNHLFSALHNKTIVIWDLSDLANIQSIATLTTGHQGTINCLYQKGNYLFSGSTDSTIKVWDLTTNQCIRTLKGDKGDILRRPKDVNCFQIEGNYLFSGSTGDIIEVWDLTTNQCIRTLKGHEGYINCLQVEGNYLFSGSDDKTIKVWDLTTNQCIRTLKGRQDIMYIKKEGNYLFSGSHNTIMKWDLNVSSEDTLLHLANMIEDISDKSQIWINNQQFRSRIFLDRIKDLCPLIRNQLYGELYEIQAFANDYFGCAEPAFLQSDGFEKKREAICRYLLKGVIKSFKKGNSQKALDLFNKLPLEIKNAIYGEFYNNNKFEHDYYGCAERVFLNLSTQKIADDKKIEAIEAFLSKNKVKR